MSILYNKTAKGVVVVKGFISYRKKDKRFLEVWGN